MENHDTLLRIIVIGLLSLAVLITICITVYVTDKANDHNRGKLAEMCLFYERDPATCLAAARAS